MARRSRTQNRRESGSFWSRRRVVSLVVLSAVGLFALAAWSLYSPWAKHVATSRMQIGAVSEARWYLRQAAAWNPNDGTIDMMLAFCYRQSGQVARWHDALKAAARKGVSQSDINRETQLYRIQTGDWEEGTESRLSELAGKGLTTYDVPAAYVTGSLVRNRPAFAKKVLDAWEADFPNDPHLLFMWGRYWEYLGDRRQSLSCYEAVVAQQPGHEQARIALAEAFEKDNQLALALGQYVALAKEFPRSAAAAIGAAKILRKMGMPDSAENVLEPFAGAKERSNALAVEMGRIAMDRGKLEVAKNWFEQAGLSESRDPFLLMTAVRLMGMQGKAEEAERYFQRLSALGNCISHIDDLVVRLEVDPNDTATAATIRRLREDLKKQMNATKTASTRRERKDKDEEHPPGRRLFALHCSACHGDNGAGNGRAARHLFPRPRDLRGESSRLVSTQNGVPTLNDTISVLKQGMPGTSMPAFDDLTDDELRFLAEEVHRMRREGLPEQFASALEAEGEEVTEEDLADIAEAVATMTSPGEPIVVPATPPPTPEVVERGRQTYLQLGCATCHDEDGIGAVDQDCYDEQGFPIRPRDLVHEPFKGGREPAVVYLRLAAGMPGTPHPSCTDVSDRELAEVVQFCLSLARQPQVLLTDHERAALATPRVYRSFVEAIAR